MENKQKNFVSAVIYIHNAENRIESFLTTVISAMENNFEHSEIICVNDCSEDNSVEVVKNICTYACTTSISIIHMSHFHGREVAMNAGVNLAIGDFVFEFDQTVPDFTEDQIMKVYRKALQGYDVVSASPDLPEKFTSKLFYRVFMYFADTPYRISTERFRILSRRVINRINSMNKIIPYRKVVYINSGLKMANIRYVSLKTENEIIDTAERHYRSALAIDSLLLFTTVGYRFSMGMTAFMMLISIFMVLYSAGVYVTAHPVEGWTTTILFLSVAFFGLFGALTVIIKYLQLLVNLVFKRKFYSYENIEKLT